MKVLLDRNLSWRLLSSRRRRFPGSAHVSAVGLGDADDADVGENAKTNGFDEIATLLRSELVAVARLDDSEESLLVVSRRGPAPE